MSGKEGGKENVRGYVLPILKTTIKNANRYCLVFATHPFSQWFISTDIDIGIHSEVWA